MEWMIWTLNSISKASGNCPAIGLGCNIFTKLTNDIVERFPEASSLCRLKWKIQNRWPELWFTDTGMDGTVGVDCAMEARGKFIFDGWNQSNQNVNVKKSILDISSMNSLIVVYLEEILFQ